MSSRELRLRKIGETKNYLLDKTNHNDLMREKYKNICNYLNYFEHLLILVSAVLGCVSICTCTSLVCISVGIPSLCIKNKN